MRRGYRLWDLDRKMSAEPTRRAILLTFTITGDWRARAPGAMIRFWNDVRNQWLGTRYYCWAEFTKAGQLHYQAWWLNPPHAKRAHLKSWVSAHWHLGFASVRYPRDVFSERYMTNYVEGYVKKMGAKRYQQVYEAMPRELRTFMTQRTEIPVAQLKNCADRSDWAYVGEGISVDPDNYGYLRHHPAYLEYRGELVHQVAEGMQCASHAYRRKRARHDWDLPPPRSRLGRSGASPPRAAAGRARPAPGRDR